MLELVRKNQPVSRADLSRLSGLQRSTVSHIIEQLIEEHWVREGAVARLPRGRRPTMVGMNEDLVAIVADVHPHLATIAVVDLNGRLLSRSTLPIGADPQKSIGRIIDCMRRLRDSHPDKSFEGVGISLPGRIDPGTERLIFAPNLKWPEYDIKGTVERGVGLRTELDNTANACLLAELWFGHMEGVRNAVLLAIAEGIGSGILANGQIVTGQSGMAGEFGHAQLDASGPRCGCGQKGCWEVFASCNAALRYYAESSRPAASAVAFHQLLSMADEGNSHAAAALEKQAESLGRGLRLIVASLSPEVILLTGEITSAWSRFEPIIQREMKAGVLAGSPPSIVPTHEGGIARLRGAAALVFQRRARPIEAAPLHTKSQRPAKAASQKRAAR